MPDRRTLLILTDAYPFGHSENFLEDELEILRTQFLKIVVVPSRRCDWSVPELLPPDGVAAHAVPLTGRYAKLAHAVRALRASPTLTKLVLREALDRRDIWLEPHGWYLLLWFAWHAARTFDDARAAMRRHALRPDETVAYAYWSWPSALSAVLLRDEFPGLRAVARCHGGDLYEERHRPAFLPFRRVLAQRLDQIAFISQQGLDYFATRWAAPREKLLLARLGVFEPNGLAHASGGLDARAPLELVSCSFVVGVKRLPFMIDVVRAVAASRPDRRVRWTHLGGGPLFEEICGRAVGAQGNNLSVRFLGHLDPAHVVRTYLAEPVDVFLNTSASEGVPVSIMEAFACGVPAVAPAVGGVPEIVDDTCGRLFPPAAAPAEVAAKIQSCVAFPDAHLRLREGARRRWAERYDARTNFAVMAGALRRSATKP